MQRQWARRGIRGLVAPGPALRPDFDGGSLGRMIILFLMIYCIAKAALLPVAPMV